MFFFHYQRKQTKEYNAGHLYVLTSVILLLLYDQSNDWGNTNDQDTLFIWWL